MQKKLACLKNEVKEHLTPLYLLHKYKPIAEFKDSGYKQEEILKELRNAEKKDESNVSVPLNMIGGKVFNAYEKELHSVVYNSSLYYSYSNLLHADVYTSARFIESELIKTLLGYFNGNSIDNCGMTNYNPTESLLLVLLAYKKMKGINSPKIILSKACPSIYLKVCYLLDIEPVFVDINETGAVRTDNFRFLVQKNKKSLICGVGFYPNQSFGVADDIEELSNICLQNNLPFHSDASYGGFMAAFTRDHTLFKKFYFQLPGVTSLSADISKFLKGPIGISFVAYRTREIRKNQFFIYGKWKGGFYASPTLPGSRVGSMATTSYATLLHLGSGNFKAFTIRQYDTIRSIKNEIKKLGKLQVIGNPTFNLLSIASSDSSFPITALYEKLKQAKWDLQIRFKKQPKSKKVDLKTDALLVDSIILQITNNNIEAINESFISDLTSAYKKLENEDFSNYIESAVLSTFRKVSELSMEEQNYALEELVFSKTEFKK